MGWRGEKTRLTNKKMRQRNGKEREMQKMLVSVERKMHIHECIPAEIVFM